MCASPTQHGHHERVDAQDLYRLTPEEFTAARDAAAKQRRADGDREGASALKALRRPSVAAWLVNRLAQDEPDLLAQLLDLGPALAQAQAGRDADALRELGAQRRELVEAVTATAVEHAGRQVTSAVREEVVATLEAALADPATAQAVRSGRLVRSLSYAGFGGVDLADAVAPEGRTSSTPPEKRGGKARKATAARKDAKEQERARRIAEAEDAAHRAAGRLDDLVRACERAERERAAAQQHAEERAAQIDRLTDELARARRERDEAARRSRAAHDAAERAVAAVSRAQDTAEDARLALDELRRG